MTRRQLGLPRPRLARDPGHVRPARGPRRGLPHDRPRLFGLVGLADGAPGDARHGGAEAHFDEVGVPRSRAENAKGPSAPRTTAATALTTHQNK